MAKPLKLTMAPGLQKYDCTGCGGCCRGRFAIIITDADRERIVEQGWTDEQLELKGKPLFTPLGSEFQLAHRADGSCVFLQEDGLCAIHAKYGEPAKPLACRMYQFRLIPVGTQIRVDVRFDCPASATNLGRPITVHKEDLAELMKLAIPADKAAALEPPPIFGAVPKTWAQFSRITQTFEQVLLDVSIDITRRMRACVNLVDLIHRSEIEPLSGRDLEEFLDTAVSIVQEEAVYDDLERKPPSGMVRTAFRQLIGVYGRLDSVADRSKPLERLSTSMRMYGGKGVIPPLREDFPRVTFADVEAARGIPTGEAALAVERYLSVHLASMGFFGMPFYGRSYVDGMNALLLTYPLVCWYARVFAIHEGLTVPDTSCIERALMIVDHQHGITPVLDTPGEKFRTKFLCEQDTLRSLISWYGS